MLPPVFPPECGGPSRVHATIDHIGFKNGKLREVRAAHKFCNGARHHDDGLPDRHLKRINAIFENQNWFKNIFLQQRKVLLDRIQNAEGSIE